MGYKGKDGRGKGNNRVCNKAYRVLTKEDCKTDSGRKPMR